MIEDRLKALRDRVERRVRHEIEKAMQRTLDATASKTSATEPVALEPLRTKDQRHELEELADEPPVVARLMVEIRSDGSRTVARGALQDELTGEQVSLVARGTTPLELAAQLTKSLLTLPLTAGQLARARLGWRAAGKRANKRGADGETSDD